LIMGFANSKDTLPWVETPIEKKEKHSRRVTSLVPDSISGDSYDSNNSTAIIVNKMLNDAERKLISPDYMQSVDLLQQATIFGSAFASAKLAKLYLEGFNSIESNYKIAAAYYSIALKLILMIPHNLWE
ncbi:6533_t:CDS:2, partial [Acaulospora colombiana]